jgi:hypothetical protein
MGKDIECSFGIFRLQKGQWGPGLVLWQERPHLFFSAIVLDIPNAKKNHVKKIQKNIFYTQFSTRACDCLHKKSCSLAGLWCKGQNMKQCCIPQQCKTVNAPVRLPSAIVAVRMVIAYKNKGEDVRAITLPGGGGHSENSTQSGTQN